MAKRTTSQRANEPTDKRANGSTEIVLGVTGSIASYKAADIVSQLKKAGFNVTCVMTPEAKEFITPLTLRTLSCNEVVEDMFKPPTVWEPVHTSLADKTDLIIIAPATANIIAKLACGIADDSLTCTVISSNAPLLVAPAMNEKMYYNKVTQENIAKLKKLGAIFIGPVKGHLACGYSGIGHLADVEDIVAAAKKLLARR